jgi:hypothetical protein
MLELQTTQITMSSREIAELVESRHDSVKRSMETLRDKEIISFTQSVEKSHDGAGARAVECYNLNKRDSYVVVAMLSPQHIGDVVDAWGRTQQSLDELILALDAFDVPKECEGMYVYAIRNVTTGNIKLGISRDPEQRIKQLQTGNDCRLELVAFRKAENRFQDETRLHHAHSTAHIRGEWFTGEASAAIQ